MFTIGHTLNERMVAHLVSLHSPPITKEYGLNYVAVLSSFIALPHHIIIAKMVKSVYGVSTMACDVAVHTNNYYK